jgi:hypothetical protein
MSTGQSNLQRRVIVEFESGSQPISGVVRERGLAPRRFTGWLALMALLEAASSAGTPRARHTCDDDDQGNEPLAEPRPGAKDQVKVESHEAIELVERS